MRAASDIANWWDEQHRQSKKALDEFVDEHPNWFGVVVATATATAMDLGAGLVDVLRFGEGAAEGGVKGFAQDGLRLLQLAPATAKLSRFALARVLVDPGGGICTWVSATKALRQVGAKAFAAVDDLAHAAGFQSAKQFGGAFVDAIIPTLQKLGARVVNLGKLNSVAEAGAAVKGDGVVLFSVKWVMNGKSVGHTLYAFRDSIGRLLIADRTGAVVKTLAELERHYPGIGTAQVYGTAALVQGTRMVIANGLAVLSMEIRAQLTVNPETAAQALEIKKSVTAASPPSPGSAAARFHTVQRGDWLSKLAQRYYGDMHKWPVIYEANRKVIGADADLIKPGQKLWIPDLPKVTARRAAPAGS